MNLFFSALFFICSSASIFSEAVDGEDSNISSCVEANGCENPYLENAGQLKAYVEYCLLEFEARQKSRRPFIFWNNSKTIATHWIPFSKGITIGRKCFKTFTKAELRAILASSFQKFGLAKPLAFYLPLGLVGSALCLVSTMAASVCVSHFTKALANHFWVGSILAGGACVAGVMLLALVISFCTAKLLASPLCASDKFAVEFYEVKDSLLSALTKAKDEEVIFRSPYSIFYPLYSYQGYNNQDALISAFFAAGLLLYRSSSYFFAGHEGVPSSINTWSSFDARIENLKKLDIVMQNEKSFEKIGLELNKFKGVVIPEIGLVA